jgi:hypothetical protein
MTLTGTPNPAATATKARCARVGWKTRFRGLYACFGGTAPAFRFFAMDLLQARAAARPSGSGSSARRRMTKKSRGGDRRGLHFYEITFCISRRSPVKEAPYVLAHRAGSWPVELTIFSPHPGIR